MGSMSMSRERRGELEVTEGLNGLVTNVMVTDGQDNFIVHSRLLGTTIHQLANNITFRLWFTNILGPSKSEPTCSPVSPIPQTFISFVELEDQQYG